MKRRIDSVLINKWVFISGLLEQLFFRVWFFFFLMVYFTRIVKDWEIARSSPDDVTSIHGLKSEWSVFSGWDGWHTLSLPLCSVNHSDTSLSLAIMGSCLRYSRQIAVSNAFLQICYTVLWCTMGSFKSCDWLASCVLEMPWFMLCSRQKVATWFSLPTTGKSHQLQLQISTPQSS